LLRCRVARSRVGGSAEIGDAILKLNREAGVTVLLVEQKLPFARRVASQFRVLEKGRSVAAGPIDRLTDEVVRTHMGV
jgi:urea transport system ATP-binding protein